VLHDQELPPVVVYLASQEEEYREGVGPSWDRVLDPMVGGHSPVHVVALQWA